MLFYPHLLDSSTGGKNWECDLGSITRVGLAARGLNPFDGSIRRRLQIERLQATDYFVVNKAESIATAIRAAAGLRPA